MDELGENAYDEAMESVGEAVNDEKEEMVLRSNCQSDSKWLIG
jgi:hypothetical protein